MSKTIITRIVRTTRTIRRRTVRKRTARKRTARRTVLLIVPTTKEQRVLRNLEKGMLPWHPFFLYKRACLCYNFL